ncbi:MAG: hypothetical protein ACHQ1H_12530 [Nitrososphaerales archaeon]
MTKEEECPRCKKPGSLHLKTVYNKQHRPFKYYYIAHYGGLSGRTRKISWCYIGKDGKKESPEGTNQKECLPNSQGADGQPVSG